MITFLASYLVWIMFAGIFVLLAIDGSTKKEIALHSLFASILTWTISHMIKSLIPTTRPFLINGNGIQTLTLHFDSSFPSVHSAVAFALATTVYLHNKKKGAFYFVLAFAVATGRVWANVHFPLDVVAGGILGIVTSYSIDILHLFGLAKKK